MNNNIQIVCDLDDTLTNNTTTEFLKYLNIDPREFYHESDRRMKEDGYNISSSYLYYLIDNYSHLISKSIFKEFGKTIKFFNGVYTLKQRLQSNSPNKIIELHLITAGIPEVVRSLKMASQFDSIWTSTILYDSDDKPYRVASTITSAEKIACLNAIQKNKKDLIDNNKSEYKVPHENIIYIGDGMTDVSAFAYNKQSGGLSIAVDHKDKWKNDWTKDHRIHHLYSADYGDNSDLFKMLVHYINK